MEQPKAENIMTGPETIRPYSYELVARLTKLKKKILLALLNEKASSVEQLQNQVYSDKRITLEDRIKKMAEFLVEEEKKFGPEAATIWRTLFMDAMNSRKKDCWFPNATGVALRRTLESLRKQELIDKDSFYENDGLFPRYKRWCPSLTEKGKAVALKIHNDLMAETKQWLPYLRESLRIDPPTEKEAKINSLRRPSEEASSPETTRLEPETPSKPEGLQPIVCQSCRAGLLVIHQSDGTHRILLRERKN